MVTETYEICQRCHAKAPEDGEAFCTPCFEVIDQEWVWERDEMWLAAEKAGHG